MSLALLFPGQGAPAPGFLHKLPACAAVLHTFQEASCCLRCDALSLDTAESLATSVGSQISLLIAGAAAFRLLRDEQITPGYVAGMSAGAFAAAVAAGSLDLPSALGFVSRRALLMQTVLEPFDYVMLAVQGLTLRHLQPLLNDDSLYIAMYNSEQQFVVGGPRRLLDGLQARSLTAGARQTSFLRTPVASHARLLLPAARQLLEFSQCLPVTAPAIPILSNRSARLMRTADAVREDLALNMAFPVHWHEIVLSLRELGATSFLEAPPGHTLTRLNLEILPEIPARSFSESRLDSIIQFARRD